MGPDTPAGQLAAGADVKGHQAVPVGVRHDQGGVVGGHRHPVGELDVVGHLPHRAVGCHQEHETRLDLLPCYRVEAGPVDVDVAAAVGHDVVPARLAEVRVRDQRPVGLPAQQPPVGGRDDHQPPVREPGGAQRQRLHPRDHLAATGEIDGDDLARRPV